MKNGRKNFIPQQFFFSTVLNIRNIFIAIAIFPLRLHGSSCSSSHKGLVCPYQVVCGLLVVTVVFLVRDFLVQAFTGLWDILFCQFECFFVLLPYFPFRFVIFSPSANWPSPSLRLLYSVQHFLTSSEFLILFFLFLDKRFLFMYGWEKFPGLSF